MEKNMSELNVKKIGLIGTSCSGKTTTAYALTSRIKSYGVLADCLTSQDRRFSFDRKYLESEEAQNWMITNLISKEIDMSLHGDIDILVTDRTPFDLMAYYLTQYSTSLAHGCYSYVQEWMKTYTLLYYLPPLPYHNDNKRPSDEFRLKVDKQILAMIPIHELDIKQLELHELLNDVLIQLNIKKPNVKYLLTERDVQALATSLGFPIEMKISSNDDVFSDTDLFVRTIHQKTKLEAAIKQVFGAFIKTEVFTSLPGLPYEFKVKSFCPEQKYCLTNIC
jgi:hypothetical protein